MSPNSKHHPLRRQLTHAQRAKLGSGRPKHVWTPWFIIFAATFVVAIGFPIFFGGKAFDIAEQYSELALNSTSERGPVSDERAESSSAGGEENKSIIKKKESTSQKADANELRPSFALVMEAVDRGSLESLQVLKPEVIEENAAFFKENSGRLLEVLLEGLLSRFQLVDWAAWHGAPDEELEYFTAAQDYLFTLNQVNPELAVLLSAAGKVFHQLYVSIAETRSFDLKAAWAAEKPERPEPTIDRWIGSSEDTQLFSEDLPKEAAFIRVFRRYQNTLTLRKLGTGDLDLIPSFELIFFLNPDSLSKAQRTELARLIKALTDDNTPLERSVLFSHIDMSKLEDFAGNAGDPLSLAIAELFAVKAVDALEVGQPLLAKEMYRLSLQSNPGLTLQAEIAKHLGSNVDRAEVAKLAKTSRKTKVTSSANSNTEKLFGEDEESAVPASAKEFKPESQSEVVVPEATTERSFSFFSIIPLALIVVVVFFVGLYLLHRREARYAHEAARSATKQRQDDDDTERSLNFG